MKLTKDFESKLDSSKTSSVKLLFKKTKVRKAHVKDVVRFSLNVFDQLKGVHHLKASDLDLMYALAYLHDTGRSIDDDTHAKMSRSIIWNELGGFTDTEKSIIAIASQYHGGAKLPKKKKDEHYKELSKLDRKKVKELVALIKLGDGFGKGPEVLIKSIKFNPKNQTFYVKSKKDISKVLKGLRKRVNGVNKVLNSDIKFEIA